MNGQGKRRTEKPATDSRVKKAGILGGGKMGLGIFHYLLDFPLELALVCSPGADTDKITRQLEKKIKRSLDAGIITAGQSEKLRQIPITRELATLADCDLVIEAVPESLELKSSLFAQLDRIVRPDAIFVSNSSSINPSEMEPGGGRSSRFAGLHFFYPVALKNIVEFTVTGKTDEHTIETVESFLGMIDRRFITLDEMNSFLLNRIFLDFQNEAFLMVNSGCCSYLQMDRIVRNHFFPFGVFDFCDSVGLDTMLASIRNYTRSYPHRSHYEAFAEKLAALVSAGKSGAKSQAGFHTYPAGVEAVEEPLNTRDITDHLRQTWLSSCKRFTAPAHIPVDDANHAIREYFDLAKGPFE